MLDLRDAGEGYGYKYGFIETDEIIFYSAFKALKDFVEKQYPGYVDWDHTEEFSEVRREFLSLYQWWTKGRSREIAEAESLMDDPEDLYKGWKVADHPNFDNYCKRLDELTKTDDKNLNRLIKIRRYLWT